jgi:toxin-antitoxin system PIN domain toxin
VIIVDVNLLLYATFDVTRFHKPAHAWLEGVLNGDAPVGLPWPSLLGFTRLAANRHVLKEPIPVRQAWEQVRAWLGCPQVWVPEPTARHADILGECLALTGMQGNLVLDAHLAALAIEHGLTLCSTDGDFARFPTLRWLNPIAAQA